MANKQLLFSWLALCPSPMEGVTFASCSNEVMLVIMEGGDSSFLPPLLSPRDTMCPTLQQEGGVALVNAHLLNY